ncbi:MAG: hypothetical protein QXO98_00120 [Sulfolobales archaeon]
MSIIPHNVVLLILSPYLRASKELHNGAVYSKYAAGPIPVKSTEATYDIKRIPRITPHNIDALDLDLQISRPANEISIDLVRSMKTVSSLNIVATPIVDHSIDAMSIYVPAHITDTESIILH